MQKMTEKIRDHRKTIKKAAIAILVVFLSYIIISMTASAIVYTEIFKRVKEPEFTTRYSYSRFEKDYKRRPVSFISGGNDLRGYFYGENNDTKNLMVVVNGLGCPSEGHLGEIAYFVDKGWRVFTYDATGIGDSGGDSAVGLSQAREDLLSCLEYLEDYKADIYVYAHSVGAYAAATLLPEGKIKAAVLISGFDKPVDLMLFRARKYVPALFAECERPFLALHNFFVFGSDGNISAVDSISGTNVPALICQSSNDETVPYETSIYKGQNMIKNPNAVYLGTREGHSAAWLSDTAAEYVKEINEEYRMLKQKYNGNIPEKVLDDFRCGVDFEKANEKDTEFLDYVLTFFANASKQKAN